MLSLESIYYNYFRDSGAVLDLKRKEIRFKRRQLLTRVNGFVVAFPCSIMKQDTLDELNKRHTITVHYGDAKKYQLSDLDFSRCVIVNNSKNPNAKKCYLSCDNLTDEEAIKVFDYLINQ